MERLWHHSIGTAAVARAIARQAGVDEEDAFLGGLLHDIGKPILIRAVAQLLFPRTPPAKRSWWQRRPAAPTSPKTLPDGFLGELFAELHSRTGALVAAKWELPQPLIDLIRHHHDGFSADPLELTVQIADRVCAHLEGRFVDTTEDFQLRDLLLALGLDDRGIERLAQDLPAALEELSGRFGEPALNSVPRANTRNVTRNPERTAS
jgi:putative nucleotidyltransferase with HDIG domain